MSLADFTGIAGVSLLLAAFFLNLWGKLSSGAILYGLLNFTGALLAGIASWMIRYYPFVVLEAIWAAVALAGLMKRKPDSNPKTQ